VAVALTALLAPYASAASTIILQAGERAVVKSIELDVGDQVDYSWDATGLVEFRIRNEDFDFTALQLTDTSRSGTFTAPWAGTYTFRFENQQDYTVTLTYSIAQGNLVLILAAVGSVIAIVVVALLAAWYLSRRKRQMMPPPPYMPPPYTPPPRP